MRQIAVVFRAISLAIFLFGSVGGKAGDVPVGPDGDIDAAQAAEGRGDHVTAFRIYRHLAETGNVYAQVLVGKGLRSREGNSSEL